MGDRVLGDPVLLVGRAEDLRSIHGAHDVFAEVGPVDLEEELEDVAIGDPVGVEDQLDRLGVPPGSSSVGLSLSPPVHPARIEMTPWQ